MFRILASALGAAALAWVGSAHAQSNSLLGGGAGPVGATRDLSAAIANGYQPFSIGAFEAYLREASFTVTERQTAPDGGGAGIVANAPNGMPFLFLFTDCGRQGCLFMEAVQPFAPGKIGVPLGLKDINAYNRQSPLQVFMTAEANDEVALRWVLPALAQCGDACAHSAVNLYFGAVMNVYEAVSKASKQVLVEAPYETEEAPLDFAAVARSVRDGLSIDDRWGTASLAFGTAAFEDLDLADRMAAEIERAANRARPGATSFPALIEAD